MYVEDLSNEEITKRIKEFCYSVIATVNKKERTERDIFDMILGVDDWIKAFFKFYKQNGSKDIMKIIDHLELMKACSENLENGKIEGKEKIMPKLREMEQLSLKLIDMIEDEKKEGKKTESLAEKPVEKKTAGAKETGAKKIRTKPVEISRAKTDTENISKKAFEISSSANITEEKILESEGIDDIKISEIE